MSQNNNDFDIFDPTGMLKSMRNDGLEAWSKTMVQLVNTSAYADATGKMLDVWLSNSEPFRKMMENVMSHALANLSMPSRDEVTRLAERLTNIELRLDDLDAKLDQCLPTSRQSGTAT
ncbi:MAG TPA: hypothetical protein VMJ32_13565 [Pirellulales bacterium]|nr:hypothetical protein [Pirellulales bacterium]